MDQASFLLTVFLILDALFIAGWIAWRWRRQRAPRRTPVPEPAQAAPELPLDRFYFGAEESDLPRESEDEVTLLATYLKTYSVDVILVGSADASGHLTRNRRLAKARAEAVRRALLARGVDLVHLRVAALEPAPGRTEADRQRLRCVRVIAKP